MKDLKKGDFITVVKWVSHLDNSYRGDCLEVMAVDLPFIRAFRHGGFMRNNTITLNLDQVEIKELSADFVDNVLNPQEKEKESENE